MPPFSVLQLTINDPGSSLSALRSNLEAASPGLLANLDRKYMVYLDTESATCGGPIADFWPDTDPNPNTNISNQSGHRRPGNGGAVLPRHPGTTLPIPGHLQLRPTARGV